MSVKCETLPDTQYHNVAFLSSGKFNLVNLDTCGWEIFSVLRRIVPQLCTKTPDKQIQNVESTSFTRKKSTNLNVRMSLFLCEFVSTSN